MSGLCLRVLVILGAIWLTVGAAQANVLQRIDALRLPSGPVSVDFSIRTSDGQITRFQSDQNGRGSSLATIVSDGNRGEKYLYTPDGLWLFAPGSRRTIRIPKIQSLRGETVVGDITQLRFDDDYRVTGQAEATVQGRTLTKLELSAKSRSSTFRRINLYVEPTTLAPVYGEYYLTSGKLFRTASFGPVQAIPFDGARIEGIAEVAFVSPDGSRTLLTIDRIASGSFSAGHFSPNAIQD